MIDFGQLAFWGFCLAQLSVNERWHAAQKAPESSFAWHWLIVTVLLILVGVCIGFIVVLYRQKEQGHNSWTRFYKQAEQEGLSPEELDLLTTIVKLAGLPEPSAIFTMDRAFREGANAYLRSEEFQHLSHDMRRNVNQAIGGLRSKLGLATMAGTMQNDSRQLIEGAMITVSLPAKKQGFAATVIRCDQNELIVQPDETIDLEAGQLWLIRYFDGRSLWEFDAPVLGEGHQPGQFVLGHSEHLRFINRRRFIRVPVNQKALVALFDFAGRGELTAPAFVESHLEELAGPGLRLRGPVQVAVGDRVLVILAIGEARTFQGMAKVRRVDNPDCALRHFAVELQGLTPSEIAELTTMTNNAAIRAKKQQQQEEEQQSTAEDGRDGASDAQRAAWKQSARADEVETTE
jgi:hypothetical protein